MGFAAVTTSESFVVYNNMGITCSYSIVHQKLAGNLLRVVFTQSQAVGTASI